MARQASSKCLTISISLKSISLLYFMTISLMSKVNCTDLKLVISDTSGEKEECKWFPLQ